MASMGAGVQLSVFFEGQHRVVSRFAFPDDFIAVDQAVPLVEPFDQLPANVLFVRFPGHVVLYIDDLNLLVHGNPFYCGAGGRYLR